MPDIKQAVVNLDYYLDSWKDLAHGLHGYIIDPKRVQLAVIAPDSVSQAALMIGHLNLFEKTQEKQYLDKAMGEADYLVNNYIWEANFYYNSCFEHKPASSEAYTTLFGNSYATLALLKLCNVLKKQKINYGRFFNVAKNNIERFIIAKCWDEKKSFLEFSHNKMVFNLSSAGLALRAILEYAKLTQNDSLIKKYCEPASLQILRFQYKNGCFTYDERDEIAPLFQCALTIKALMTLYKKTREEKLFVNARDAAAFIAKKVHPKEKFFYYGYRGERFLKFPLYVAQSAVIASVLKEFSNYKSKFEAADYVLNSVLSKQYANGALPSFNTYYNIFEKTEASQVKKKRWQDILPCPCWNALALEYLTELLPVNPNLPTVTAIFPCDYEASEYTIKERDSTVVFFDRMGALAAKWFKKHDTWLFGKLYTSMRKRRVKAGKRAMRSKEKQKKKVKKPSKKAVKKEKAPEKTQVKVQKAVEKPTEQVPAKLKEKIEKSAEEKKPLFGFLFKK